MPILILVIAPLCTALGYGLSGCLLALYEHSPWLFGLVCGAIWELLVVFGLHWILSPVMLNNISLLGYDMIIAIVMVPTAGAMVGNYCYLRRHEPHSETLTGARHSSLLAVFFGITEPVLYTYLVARSKLFAVIAALSGVGGLLMALAEVRMYSISLSSTFAVVAAYRPEREGQLWPLLCFVVIVLVCFTLALGASWLGRQHERAAAQANTQVSANAIGAVCAGHYVPLTAVNDLIFSSLMLGEGYALQPDEDVVYAPCDGTLSEDIVFAHALGLTTPSGTDILVHVGINTVRLEGKYFKLLVAPGSTVTAGTPLLHFERAQIAAAGYDPTIIVICTPPEGWQVTHAALAAGAAVCPGQELLAVSSS